MQSDSPEARIYKRMELLKWSAGLVVAIFLGGFAVAGYLNQYETKAAATVQQQQHIVEHSTVNAKLEDVGKRLIQVRVYQARDEERDKLVSRRLELLLERSDRPTSTTERRQQETVEQRLTREIAVQEARVQALERDPMAGLREDL